MQVCSNITNDKMQDQEGQEMSGPVKTTLSLQTFDDMQQLQEITTHLK